MVEFFIGAAVGAIFGGAFGFCACAMLGAGRED